MLYALEVPKNHTQENVFKNAVIETIYKLMIETAAKDSHTLYFPDMYITYIMQVCKEKKCIISILNFNFKFIYSWISAKNFH